MSGVRPSAGDASFTVDAFPTRQFRGTVTQVRNAPKVTQNVVSYETIVDVTNEDLKLRPGMTANVSIIVAQRAGVVRVANSALRVRVPDELKVVAPPPAGAAALAATVADAEPRTLSEEERRTAMQEVRQIMREGGGSAEAAQKAQARAKELGIEFDPATFASRGGRGGNPGERGGRRGGFGGIEHSTFGAGINVSNAPRTVYRLVDDTGDGRRALQASVRLGISDGINTEVLDGLNEGDTLITAVVMPGAAPILTAPQQQAQNPLMGGRGSFGGGRRGF